MSMFQDHVRQFHVAMGQAAPNKIELKLSAEALHLRYNLMLEELHEFREAASAYSSIHFNPVAKHQCYVEMIDALVDLLYVTFGTAVTMGVDLDPFWDEVQKANMAKLGPDGRPIVRADGKILKPTGWRPPDIEGILKRMLEKENG